MEDKLLKIQLHNTFKIKKFNKTIKNKNHNNCITEKNITWTIKYRYNKDTYIKNLHKEIRILLNYIQINKNFYKIEKNNRKKYYRGY